MLMTATDTASLSELMLRPSRWRWLVLLFFAASSTVIAVPRIHDGDQRGWFVLSIFGIFTLTALIVILPAASYLRLTREGFTVCSLYRKSFTRWSEVTEFRGASVGLNTLVGFDYAPEFQRWRRGRRLSAAISGCEGALPDTYGLGAVKLAVLMTAYREQALAASAVDGG